jgi:hypothetical protein
LQVYGFPSVQAGGFLSISNFTPAVHAGLDLSAQSGLVPSAQFVAPLLTSV